MAFINTETEAYPLYRQDIEAALPNVVWVDDNPPAPYAVAPEPPRTLAAHIAQVNADRDARIDGGFDHAVDGVTYRFQSKPSDRENVMGMGMAAQASGGEAGDLRWFDPATDFKWITADNTLCPMDAPQVIDLFKAGAKFKATVTFMARAYKDAMIADGTDAGAQAIYDNIIWPD
jgi:hypothetical protein